MSIKKIIEDKCKDCCNGKSCDCNCKSSNASCNNGAVYGFGVIGAAFYFFPMISSFSDFLWAVGKSLLWPAMLVYQALNLLKL